MAMTQAKREHLVTDKAIVYSLNYPIYIHPDVHGGYALGPAYYVLHIVRLNWSRQGRGNTDLSRKCSKQRGK